MSSTSGEVIASPEQIKAMSTTERAALVGSLVAAGFDRGFAERADVVIKDPVSGRTHVRSVATAGADPARSHPA